MKKPTTWANASKGFPSKNHPF